MSDEVVPFPGSGPSVPDEVVALVEALLFASGDAVGLKTLAEALPDVEPVQIQDALELLEQRYAQPARGIRLHRVGGRYQLRTASVASEAVLRMLGTKPQRLSAASLEVLSIVAYQQPVTRGEIEVLRGVDCGAVVKGLLDKGLLRVAGRRDEPGRPLEYRTSRAFLEVFGLNSLRDLPTLRERRELEGDDSDDESP